MHQVYVNREEFYELYPSSKRSFFKKKRKKNTFTLVKFSIS